MQAKVNPVRKILIVPFILTLSALLSGCALLEGLGLTHKDPAPTEDTSSLIYPSNTEAAPGGLYRFPSIQDVNEGDVGVHPVDQVYDVPDSDGNPILRVSLSLPAITYVENIGLQSGVEAALAETTAAFTGRIDSLSARYLTDASSGYSFFLIPSYSVSYSITSYSENLISLLFTVTETNADGIVNRSYVCKVIDLSAGFAVDLSTLFTAGLSDKLLSMINSALAARSAPLLQGYESIAASSLPSSFLIVPEGICFLFSTGTLTPADQGDVTVLLSTDGLNELLSEYGAVILEAGNANLPEED